MSTAIASSWRREPAVSEFHAGASWPSSPARPNRSSWTIRMLGLGCIPAGDRAFARGLDVAVSRGASGGTLRPGGGRPGVEVTKPTIAALNGAAFGGGMEMALACDVRICSTHATMGLAEVKRGLTPINGLYDLPRIIGSGPALWWMLSGEAMSPREAYRLGEVTRVVPFDELLPTAVAMGETIAANSPLAVLTVRHILRNLADMPAHSARRAGQPLVDSVWGSADAQEGIPRIRGGSRLRTGQAQRLTEFRHRSGSWSIADPSKICEVLMSSLPHRSSARPGGLQGRRARRSRASLRLV